MENAALAEELALNRGLPMQEFIALEVWILAIAAPCILSWVLGEVHGAARVRSYMEQRVPTVEEAASIAGTPANLTMQSRTPASAQEPCSAVRPGRSLAAANAGLGDAIDAAIRPQRVIAATRDLSASERSALYEEMPTPTQRSEEADWRRKELAALLSENEGALAPEAAEVLSQYKVSVAQMAQANIEQAMDEALAAFAPPIDEPRPRSRAYRDALEERYQTEVPEQIACPAP